MPKCPSCGKEVYFDNSPFLNLAERVTSLGKDWHRPCLKCAECNKTLSAGQHSEHDGKPYCNVPCYQKLFGPTITHWNGTNKTQAILIDGDDDDDNNWFLKNNINTRLCIGGASSPVN
ncbi:unnamed protein product [Rodentolepis nana]|uniref:LIM zinc-binding domain-containing protein n=1 Tax=Rodentolepis nana TaxID=102285 RepID=A0A158QIJ4_RODNA|nr:unnamed protein product [Rodentolepis nana]